MAKIKCEFCAVPDFFEKILSPTQADIPSYNPAMRRHGIHWPKVRRPKTIKLPKNVIHDGFGSRFGIDPSKVVRLKSPGIRRGKFHIRTVTDADMTPAYDGFKIEIIGIESKTRPPMPSGAFFSVTTTGEGKDASYVSYNAARITHRDSNIVIESHWTPEHGRIVTLRGFESVSTNPQELSIINTALKFYRREPRGGAKITEDMFRVALAKSGKDAKQKEVATALRITERGLEKWRTRQGINSWKELIERYNHPEHKIA